MATTNYIQGFKNGYHYVKNNPNVDKVGRVFWVGNPVVAPPDGIGPSDGNPGTPLKPFATLQYAISRCTANQGDSIYVYPGHTTSVTEAGGLDFNVDGVTVTFLGDGVNRAAIIYSESTAASVTVTADSITLINPAFFSGMDALEAAILITGVSCKIVNGEYNDGDGIDTTKGIVITAAATGARIYGWRYYTGDESGTQKESHIEIIGPEYIELVDVDISGDFSVSCIDNNTTKIDHLRFFTLYLHNRNTGPKPGITLVSTTNGQAKEVDIRIDSGQLWVDSLADVTWDDECLGYSGAGSPPGIPISGSGTIGDTFWITKDFVSNTVTDTPAVFTGVSTGLVLLEQVVVQTDATGLAGAVSWGITMSNGMGNNLVFAINAAEVAGGLSADKNSVLNYKPLNVIDEGTAMSFSSSGGPGTGTGVVRFYLQLRKMTPNAHIEVLP